MIWYHYSYTLADGTTWRSVSPSRDLAAVFKAIAHGQPEPSSIVKLEVTRYGDLPAEPRP